LIVKSIDHAKGRREAVFHFVPVAARVERTLAVFSLAARPSLDGAFIGAKIKTG
jgi:hypothetical protein